MLISPPPICAAEEFSAADRLLFGTDHLADISEPTTLHYLFQRRGSQAEPFEDRIDIKISGPTEAGAKRVQIGYFSGDRRRQVPPMENVRGNPVVMLFLQRDVNELGRLTGGGWRYFQKRVRLALAKAEETETISVSWNGRVVEAQRITLTPFLNDPNRERFADYAGRTYMLVLSSEVPGHFFQLQSSTPDRNDANAEPLLEEVLTLVSDSPG